MLRDTKTYLEPALRWISCKWTTQGVRAALCTTNAQTWFSCLSSGTSIFTTHPLLILYCITGRKRVLRCIYTLLTKLYVKCPLCREQLHGDLCKCGSVLPHKTLLRFRQPAKYDTNPYTNQHTNLTAFGSVCLIQGVAWPTEPKATLVLLCTGRACVGPGGNVPFVWE